MRSPERLGMTILAKNILDTLRLFRIRSRKREGRDFRIPEFRPKSPDEIGVVLDAVDRTARAPPRNADMVKESFSPDIIACLRFRSAQKRDPGRARAAMKIEKNVIGFLPDPPDEPDEAGEALFGRDGDDAVEFGIPFDELSIRLFDKVGQPGRWKMPLEKGHGGRGHDDIADPPRPDDQNFRGIQFLVGRSGSIVASSMSMIGISSLI